MSVTENFLEDIKKVVNAEEVESVVIGEMGWGDYRKELVPLYNDQLKGKLLSWEEAEKWLNYEYDSGYGAPSCNAIYVWTKTRVLFVVQYEGSTWIEEVPRNPTNIMPRMPGG